MTAHRLAKQYNSVRFEQICYRLHLHTSTFTEVKTRQSQQLQANDACCVMCANTGQNPRSRTLAAIVHTSTYRGQWNDRYLCEKHYPQVKRAIGRIKLALRAERQEA